MALRPEAVEDWCQLMPNLLEEVGWTTALSTEEASLTHMSCPWGGHLIKFELRDILVQDAPTKSSNVMVRPEVRSLLQEQFPINGLEVKKMEVVSPGECVVEGSMSWSILRLCGVLFGDIGSQVMNYFFEDNGEVSWHQKLRRNYPRDGDSACAFWMEDGKPQELVLVVRPEAKPGKFTAFVVVRVPENNFANWATEYFSCVLKTARSTADWFLNRPGISALRQVDEHFYVVVSMQSFKRGMPLLPALEHEKPITEIDAGQIYGLKRWVRFEAVGTRKFHLTEYLKAFCARLGFEVDTYDSLDGETLVPYQCVLPREEWEKVQERFREGYPLQKTAYRRANGGSGAPGIHEDVAPKFVSTEVSDWKERLLAAKEPKLVVRKTFLDLEDEEVEEQRQQRHPRRPKTTALGRPVFVS